jgi:quercetin dioxygenase-like cupin family protein
VLWQRGGAESGVLVVPGGSQLGAHRHRVNHHHIWVLDGTAMVMDQLIGPGSYVHVPAGVDHDIDARMTAGCTVFYVYEPAER